MIRQKGDSVKCVDNPIRALEELTKCHYDVAVIGGKLDTPINGVTLSRQMEELYPSTKRIGVSDEYLVRDPEVNQSYHAVFSNEVGVEHIYRAAGIRPSRIRKTISFGERRGMMRMLEREAVRELQRGARNVVGAAKAFLGENDRCANLIRKMEANIVQGRPRLYMIKGGKI